MVSKEELEEMYLIKGMNQYDIAKEIGVAQSTICLLMNKYDIDVRAPLDARPRLCSRPSKDSLEKMYFDKGMSQPEIAKEFGVSNGVVHWWMLIYDIKARTLSESKIGENNPNWCGGITFQPYCEKFNNEFREAVRKRDDYMCQLCGHEQLLGGKKLSVHHIHYEKSDCWPDVVALCNSCNSKVNVNRDYWEQYFENNLFERGLTCWSINNDVA